MSDGNISSSTALKIGVARQSDGTSLFGIPGQSFTSQSTGSPSAGEIRYSILIVNYPITLTDWLFEVTTGPASAANARVGLYRADGNCQPVGAPLYDSGDVPIAMSFTGTKTMTGLNIVLSPGIYLCGLNIDVAMAMRSALNPTPIARTVLGASSLGNITRVTSAYGAMPNPGTLWNSIGSATSAYGNNIFWRWTE